MKKDEKIGWSFPSSGGGMEGGFNDPGIETFAGTPFEGLAREVIQNSLDARASLASVKPVVVSFQVEKINSEDFPGHGEILGTMKKCLTVNKGEEKAEEFFSRAVKILTAPKITCLKVMDYETTGLRDGKGGDLKTGQWHRLVKATGLIAKDNDPNAGGAFGIGKSAPFVISDLRTVFYSTRYKDSGGDVCERAQGKAILASHELSDGDESQAVGFFGWQEKDGKKCVRLTGDSIPDLLRRKDSDGTTLLIPGLSEVGGWQERIIAAVVSNYFYAVHKGDLEVMIDHPTADYISVNAETLPRLLADKKIQKSGGGVRAAHEYYLAITEGQKKEKVLPTLGHCILWISLDENFHKSVAILRRGMKITDRQPRLIRWDSCANFAAACMCDDKEGNALLRQMENPEHNAFQPGRFRVREKEERGKKALKELVKWIHDEVEELAEGKVDEVVPLNKMSKFFSTPDDNLPGENAEKDFDGGSSVRIKPAKLPRAVAEDIDDGEEDGSGEEEGEFPSEGTGGGGGGKGTGGGKGSARRASDTPMKIDAVRVLSMPDVAEKQVMFTPRQTGAAALSLKVAGDSFTEDIGGIAEVLDGDYDKIEGGNVLLRVVAGERLSLKVRLANPFSGSLSVTLGNREKKSNEVDS